MIVAYIQIPEELNLWELLLLEVIWENKDKMGLWKSPLTSHLET